VVKEVDWMVIAEYICRSHYGSKVDESFYDLIVLYLTLMDDDEEES